LQVAPRGCERIAEGDEDVFVLVLVMMRTIDGDRRSARDHQLEAGAVEVARARVWMRSLDDDVAAHQTIVEALEPLDHLPDLGFDGVGWLHSPKRDLKLDRHGIMIRARTRASQRKACGDRKAMQLTTST
jgi:hypothetical protein